MTYISYNLLPWLHPKLDEAHTELETNVIPCGTKFLLVLIFVIFAGFFAVHKKKFPQNKTTATFFFCKNLLHCRNYIQKYWFEGENARDNSVDNTSSSTLVVDPLQ